MPSKKLAAMGAALQAANEGLQQAAAYLDGQPIPEPDMTVRRPVSEVAKPLPVAMLHAYARHTFVVMEDVPEFERLMEDIRERGVQNPLVVRLLPDNGGYEIIEGHRRHRAAQLAGTETVPCFIRRMSDEEADIAMVLSNLTQRDEIPPSEKARSYKLLMDAMKKTAGRRKKDTEEDGKRIVDNLSTILLGRSIDAVAEQTGEHSKQIQRYIRLTNLISPLLQSVDAEHIPVNAGYELSFLSEASQALLSSCLLEDTKVSIAQAKALRVADENDELDIEQVHTIMGLGKGTIKKTTSTTTGKREKAASCVPPEHRQEIYALCAQTLQLLEQALELAPDEKKLMQQHSALTRYVHSLEKDEGDI